MNEKSFVAEVREGAEEGEEQRQDFLRRRQVRRPMPRTPNTSHQHYDDQLGEDNSRCDIVNRNNPHSFRH